MRKKNKSLPFLENVEIIDAGSEGKAIGKFDNKVIFSPFLVPGDIVDIQVNRKKRAYFEGRAVKFHKYSEMRVIPVCEHFGLCGGCKWQNMAYEKQLYYKQKQVTDNFDRIGKFDYPAINPIMATGRIFFYRNKLEFTFSNRRWFVNPPMKGEEKSDNPNGLGFHLPGMFDRIIDLDNCYLQDNPSNRIRLVVKEYAIKHDLPFYNVKNWTGLLRNLVIRNTSIGELMIILVLNYDEQVIIHALLDHLKAQFPEITSLNYVINNKRNPDLSDLDIINYDGLPYITEDLAGLKFRIGPKSFFQTNSEQALNLYNKVVEYSQLSSKETVYDLYTGTGTIANFIAGKAKKVVGIEYVAAAIDDARENSLLNNIHNTSFYAGDIVDILNDSFIEENGKPDIIITDPPRSGMHEKVVRQIEKVAPSKIVYVSCNPATQARDIALLASTYNVKEVQPVDMFPHTQHVENVVLLLKKD